jgi:hypothetical protein
MFSKSPSVGLLHTDSSMVSIIRQYQPIRWYPHNNHAIFGNTLHRTLETHRIVLRMTIGCKIYSENAQVAFIARMAGNEYGVIIVSIFMLPE